MIIQRVGESLPFLIGGKMKDLIIKRLREESIKIIRKDELSAEEVQILAIIYSKELEAECNKKLSEEYEENRKMFVEKMKSYMGGA